MLRPPGTIAYGPLGTISQLKTFSIARQRALGTTLIMCPSPEPEQVFALITDVTSIAVYSVSSKSVSIQVLFEVARNPVRQVNLRDVVVSGDATCSVFTLVCPDGPFDRIEFETVNIQQRRYDHTVDMCTAWPVEVRRGRRSIKFLGTIKSQHVFVWHGGQGNKLIFCTWNRVLYSVAEPRCFNFFYSLVVDALRNTIYFATLSESRIVIYGFSLDEQSCLWSFNMPEECVSAMGSLVACVDTSGNLVVVYGGDTLMGIDLRQERLLFTRSLAHYGWPDRVDPMNPPNPFKEASRVRGTLQVTNEGNLLILRALSETLEHRYCVDVLRIN